MVLAFSWLVWQVNSLVQENHMSHTADFSLTFLRNSNTFDIAGNDSVLADWGRQAKSAVEAVFDVEPSIAQQQFAANLPIIEAEGNPSACYQIAKRTMDIVGAVALLLVLSPILLATLVALTITTKGRPFFVQERVGHLGRRFRFIKFRTMHLNADQMQHEVENQHSDGPIFKNRQDPRITPLGRILRKTSIDELPQLLHVIAGQMSLVGPRPPVPHEVEDYETWQRRRLAVKPGLTCLWQVSGRSEIGFEDWCRMDIWYATHQNLYTDIKLLLLTPYTVLTCRGAY